MRKAYKEKRFARWVWILPCTCPGCGYDFEICAGDSRYLPKIQPTTYHCARCGHSAPFADCVVTMETAQRAR